MKEFRKILCLIGLHQWGEVKEQPRPLKFNKEYGCYCSVCASFKPFGVPLMKNPPNPPPSAQ